MASLAGMLKQRGFRVTGSDAAAYPPMSDFLASLDIPVAQPFDAANLEPRPDLVVVGNAISRGNSNWSTCSTSAFRSARCRRFCTTNSCAGKEVSGRRGNARQDHDHFDAGVDLSLRGIAAVVSDWRDRGKFRSSFQLGEGKHFILEGDEYDTAFFDKGPKFLHYFPDAVDSDLGRVRSRRHLQRSGRGGDRVQAPGEPGAAARAHRRLRYRARASSAAWRKAFCPVERYGRRRSRELADHESAV